MSGVSTATDGSAAFLLLVLCTRVVSLSSAAGAPAAALIGILRGRPGRRLTVVVPAINNGSRGSSLTQYMSLHVDVAQRGVDN